MINPQSRSPQDFQERGADHFKFLRPSRFVVVDDNHDAIVAERMGLKGSLTRAPHLAHFLPQRVPRAIQSPITNPAAVTIKMNTSPPSTGLRPNRRRLATNTPTARDATISTLRIRTPTCGRLAGIVSQHTTITIRLRPAATAGRRHSATPGYWARADGGSGPRCGGTVHTKPQAIEAPRPNNQITVPKSGSANEAKSGVIGVCRLEAGTC